YSGETQAATLGALSRAAGWVQGRDAARWREIGAELREIGGRGCGSAVCALETALLDAVCRSSHLPLWRHFGGAGAKLETDMTVPLGTRGEARDAARHIR